MKDTSQYTFKSINYFFNNIRNFSLKFKDFDPRLTCPISERLFYLIINQCNDSPEGKANLSTTELMMRTGQNRKKINNRLRLLAKYSLITCYSEWVIDKKFGKRDPQTIRTNPAIVSILDNRTNQAMILQCIKIMFEQAEFRSEGETDLQGFSISVKYGDKEPDSIMGLEIEKESQNFKEYSESSDEAFSKILERTEKEKRKAAQRAKDNKYWREKSAVFANQAGVLWSKAQEKHGYGSAMPNWSGDPKSMPQQAKTERYELIKTLEQYGGKIAALSWYVYVAAIQEIDNKTLRPKFDNQNPHRQFITVDRKPSSFTKHMNSLVTSPDYKTYSTEKWSNILPILEKWFGDTLNLLPRGKMSEADNPTGKIPGVDLGPSIGDVT